MMDGRTDRQTPFRLYIVDYKYPLTTELTRSVPIPVEIRAGVGPFLLTHAKGANKRVWYK